MTTTNLIYRYKDIQNSDIAKDLHRLNAQTYLISKLVKNPYLKDQIQRCSISVLHNFSKALSINSKPATSVKYLFSSYGSCRETRRWLIIFQQMNIIPDNIDTLADDYLTICYQLISMINRIIEENHIIWSTKENAKIFYHESEKLNLFNTLELLTISTNDLLSPLENDSFKYRIIADACSVLLNIEEGLAYCDYQDLVYHNFLFNSIQQTYIIQSDLETLIAIKDIDATLKINAAKAVGTLNQYVITGKILIKLINNVKARALKEQIELETLKKKNKKAAYL